MGSKYAFQAGCLEPQLKTEDMMGSKGRKNVKKQKKSEVKKQEEKKATK
ncbi:MAG: hypothetical protein V1737_03470 [Chloroflexota bacterium]